MRSDWPVAKLGELTINLDTKRRPVKEAERRPGPYPYYGASGVVDYVDGFLFEGEHLLIAEDGENLRTRNTPVAFRATGRFWVNNHAHIVKGNSRARTRFLEYAVLAADLTPYLTGAVMPKLTQGNLNKLELPCPTLSEQDALVGVLGALDDRIDLLRQTNTTLESIAQALFKSWFIDFDPVRAKAEGREPEGIDAETAALFPDGFEGSELGEIPKGWRAGRFADIATLAKGNVNPLESPETTFEHYSLPAFDVAQLPSFELGETIKSNKTRVPENAILQSKLNPHIPRIWFTGPVGDKAVCSTEFLPWVARDDSSPELVYCTLRSTEFSNQVHTLVTGTSNSHQRVKPDQVALLSVIVAPSPISNRFKEITRPMLQKICSNRLQAKNLESLRDTLLPRLISGKLRLPEAQTKIQDALA